MNRGVTKSLFVFAIVLILATSMVSAGWLSDLFVGKGNYITGHAVSEADLIAEHPEIPRVAYWWGKVNRHINMGEGIWVTDQDGHSGANLNMLNYCVKIYPNTVSVREYKEETLYDFREAGNRNSHISKVMTYECVQEEGKPLLYWPLGYDPSAAPECSKDSDCSEGKACTINGRCVVPSPWCTDLDGGLVTETKSATYNTETTVQWIINKKIDYCIDNPEFIGEKIVEDGFTAGGGLGENRGGCQGDGCYLIEFYCKENSYYNYKGFSCPGGCNDGACTTVVGTGIEGVEMYNKDFGLQASCVPACGSDEFCMGGACRKAGGDEEDEGEDYEPITCTVGGDECGVDEFCNEISLVCEELGTEECLTNDDCEVSKFCNTTNSECEENLCDPECGNGFFCNVTSGCEEEQVQECTDSDNGEDIYLRGITKGDFSAFGNQEDSIEGDFVQDYCLQMEFLDENLIFPWQNPEFANVEPETIYDFLVESCVENCGIYEMSCGEGYNAEGDLSTIVLGNAYSCPNGCEDGACIRDLECNPEDNLPTGKNLNCAVNEICNESTSKCEYLEITSPINLEPDLSNAILSWKPSEEYSLFETDLGNVAILLEIEGIVNADGKEVILNIFEYDIIGANTKVREINSVVNDGGIVESWVYTLEDWELGGDTRVSEYIVEIVIGEEKIELDEPLLRLKLRGDPSCDTDSDCISGYRCDSEIGKCTLPECAKIGELFSATDSEFPRNCCEGLDEVLSMGVAELAIGNACYDTGLENDYPHVLGGCINLDDGACGALENVCNSPEDCANGQNSYYTIETFCASAYSFYCEEGSELAMCDLCDLD